MITALSAKEVAPVPPCATAKLATFKVTVPLVPPPDKPVPAVTPVISPTVAVAHSTIPPDDTCKV